MKASDVQLGGHDAGGQRETEPLHALPVLPDAHPCCGGRLQDVPHLSTMALVGPARRARDDAAQRGGVGRRHHLFELREGPDPTWPHPSPVDSLSGGAVDLYVVNDGPGDPAGSQCRVSRQTLGTQFSNPIAATNAGTPLLPEASSELLRLTRMSGANVLSRGKAMVEGGWRCVIEVTYKGPNESPLTAKAPVGREVAIALSGYDPATPPAGPLGPIE